MRCTRRAGAIAATLTALLLGAIGCGGDDNGEGVGPLSWERTPRVFVPKGLPSDRVTAKDVKLVDDRGRRVAASITFLSGFVHGLYPPTREPSRLPDTELLRTGRIARILPGKLAPITVSWRTRPGVARPTRLDYGRGFLLVPPR